MRVVTVVYIYIDLSIYLSIDQSLFIKVNLVWHKTRSSGHLGQIELTRNGLRTITPNKLPLRFVAKKVCKLLYKTQFYESKNFNLFKMSKKLVEKQKS